MKKIITTLLSIYFGSLVIAQPTTNTVWLNEFHYDGVTTYGQSDAGEFVEFAVHNSIVSNPTELAKLQLVLYTGGAIDNTALASGRGLPYNNTGLLYNNTDTYHNFSTGGFTMCPVAGSSFTLLSKTLPILQDVPAAFAIIYNNTVVVQLVSYEKAFTIASAARGGGPAAGNTTILLKRSTGDTVKENALTPANHSIALTGAGNTYSNFSWDDNAAMMATPCAANQGQTFVFTVPVGILFTAKTENKNVLLKWTGAPEVPGTIYKIERATEGGLFTLKAQVNGISISPGSLHNYQYTFTDVEPGIYNFRIKQIEPSGRVIYSTIIKVFIKTPYRYALTEAYPNPVKSKAYFSLMLEKTQTITIEVFNSSGQSVKPVQSKLLDANTSHQLIIDCSDLPNGKYYNKVRGELFTQVKSFVVAK